MADHGQILGLGVEQIGLGDNHVRLGQGKATLDLLGIGLAAHAGVTAQPDLVGDAQMDLEILVGDVFQLLLAQHIRVDTGGVQGQVLGGSLQQVGG